jgi:hypothetical protein
MWQHEKKSNLIRLIKCNYNGMHGKLYVTHVDIYGYYMDIFITHGIYINGLCDCGSCILS